MREAVVPFLSRLVQLIRFLKRYKTLKDHGLPLSQVIFLVAPTGIEPVFHA